MMATAVRGVGARRGPAFDADAVVHQVLPSGLGRGCTRPLMYVETSCSPIYGLLRRRWSASPRPLRYSSQPVTPGEQSLLGGCHLRSCRMWPCGCSPAAHTQPFARTARATVLRTIAVRDSPYPSRYAVGLAPMRASKCAELTPTAAVELRCLISGQVTGVGGRSGSSWAVTLRRARVCLSSRSADRRAPAGPCARAARRRAAPCAATRVCRVRTAAPLGRSHMAGPRWTRNRAGNGLVDGHGSAQWMQITPMQIPLRVGAGDADRAGDGVGGGLGRRVSVRVECIAGVVGVVVLVCVLGPRCGGVGVGPAVGCLLLPAKAIER